MSETNLVNTKESLATKKGGPATTREKSRVEETNGTYPGASRKILMGRGANTAKVRRAPTAEMTTATIRKTIITETDPITDGEATTTGPERPRAIAIR